MHRTQTTTLNNGHNFLSLKKRRNEGKEEEEGFLSYKFCFNGFLFNGEKEVDFFRRDNNKKNLGLHFKRQTLKKRENFEDFFHKIKMLSLFFFGCKLQ